MKKLVSLICAIVLTCSFTACTNDNNNTNSPSTGEVTVGDFSKIVVWSGNSSDKFLSDTEYSTEEMSKLDLSIDMAKNEYESVQLMITPQVKVNSYTVEVSDLTSSSGEVISKDNIAIFNEKYAKTKVNSNSTYKQGEYPDPLLPFDVAVEYGENKIEADKNQGVWIRVKSEKDTVAGVYSGKVTLTCDGSEKEIPLTVKVRDIEIPTGSSLRTLFRLYKDLLGLGGDSSNEMYEKYYEFFLDYRINLGRLPAVDASTDYIAYAKKIYDDERVNTYEMPYFYHQSWEDKLNSKFNDAAFDDMMDLVSALAYESVKDGKNYLKKMVFYDITTDEYAYAGSSRYEYVTNRYNRFREACKKTAENLESWGIDLDSVEGLRTSVEYLPIVSVADYVQDITELANVWVPKINELASNQDMLDKWHSVYEESDVPTKELWTYTCVGPTYPYPSYHIDDCLFSSRLYSWMAYEYNLTGNLYYSVTLWGSEFVGSDGEITNPYENYNQYGQNNGDGFLCYPGSYYGIDGPVPSMRLESIRDGMEEYELIKMLDTLYNGLGEYYGVDGLNYINEFKEVYDSLYNYGTVLRDFDTDTIKEARTKLFDLIEKCTSNDKVIVESQTTVGDVATIKLLVSGDVEVTGGSTIANTETVGNGKRLTYNFNINTFDAVTLTVNYTVNGEAKTYTKLIKGKQATLMSNTTQEDLDRYYVDGAGNKALGKVDGIDGINLTIPTKVQQTTFVPAFLINVSGLTENNLRAIRFAIYNANDSDVKLDISLMTATSRVPVNSVVLTKGWNYIDVNCNEVAFSDIRRILFEFENSGLGYNIGIGGISYYEN